MGQRIPVRRHSGTTPHNGVGHIGNSLETGVCHRHTLILKIPEKLFRFSRLAAPNKRLTRRYQSGTTFPGISLTAFGGRIAGERRSSAHLLLIAPEVRGV
ncbi:MAG: hypothetical protein F4Y85_15455 [Gammaproteobacteria bacterium]|nr:hypothetical protein [Gammaproteobacteria bacterium]